jgi:cell division protein FtsA
MDDISRYAVGLDVGTENVRAVVASISQSGKISVVGYNEGKNTGMRKGVVVNLSGPSEAIDKMLGEVERMSGYQINSAFVSTNGAQIISAKVKGMIAVGTVDHEITEQDLMRVQEVAEVGQIPQNREALIAVPLDYALDGQAGIKDPVGMKGARLEMNACVVTSLVPNNANLKKSTENAEVRAEKLIPSAVAAGKAVLNERQLEQGVAVIDMGAATTSVAIYEEGNLQYVGVVPEGSNNITNDLAIMLKVNTEIAEEIKCRFVTGSFDGGKIVLKTGREEMHFDREQVNSVVKDRLNEIFEKVRKELKHAGYDRRLPEGVVLTGGGAKMRDIDVFVRDALEASVKIGIPNALDGVSESVQKPEYAAAVGLMLMAIEDGGRAPVKKEKNGKSGGLLKRFFSKF